MITHFTSAYELIARKVAVVDLHSTHYVLQLNFSALNNPKHEEITAGRVELLKFFQVYRNPLFEFKKNGMLSSTKSSIIFFCFYFASRSYELKGVK